MVFRKQSIQNDSERKPRHTLLLSSRTELLFFRCQTKTRRLKTIFGTLAAFSWRGFSSAVCHLKADILMTDEGRSGLWFFFQCGFKCLEPSCELSLIYIPLCSVSCCEASLGENLSPDEKQISKKLWFHINEEKNANF